MMDGLVCGYLMRQITFVWERIAKELLKNSDLNWTQLAVLGLLKDAKNQEMSLKELEKALSLTQSVVARSVTQMAEAGYLEYIPDPDDKRVKRVHIVPRGKECHEAVFSSMGDGEAPLLKGMSEGESLLFKELLQKALANSIGLQDNLKKGV